MSATFLWYDLETFGSKARVDRPVQAGAIRTDLDLNEVGEPFEAWCRLSPDYLPHPEAVLLTGIGPREVEEKGLREREWILALNGLMSHPGTCNVGFNSLRFDDEVVRFTLYRNLLDPYGREWKNGNSRWDLLDVMRLARTFRPEGLVWSDDADGVPSFRLGSLTAANGIAHDQAHTALADVRATLALARKLKTAQPRLWDFALKFRDKRHVEAQLDLGNPKPLIHVSGMFKATLGCFSLVWPLWHKQGNTNEVLVWDLREPFEPFLGLDAAELRRRAFTKQAELDAEGHARLPVKGVHLNKGAIVFPELKMLPVDARERYQVDPEAAQRRGQALKRETGFLARIREAMTDPGGRMPQDPDMALYDGFFPDEDRDVLDRIRRSDGAALATLRPRFLDPRLPELFFRYRARNWPEFLDADETARWQAHCEARLAAPPDPDLLSHKAFRAELDRCRLASPESNALLDDLEALHEALLQWQSTAEINPDFTQIPG